MEQTQNTEPGKYVRHRQGVSRKLDLLRGQLRQLRVELRQAIETKAAVRKTATKEKPHD